MKNGVWKVNWSQRGPQETTDLKDYPEVFQQVKDLLDDLFRFAHDNVSSFHPLKVTLLLINLSASTSSSWPIH